VHLDCQLHHIRQKAETVYVADYASDRREWANAQKTLYPTLAQKVLLKVFTMNEPSEESEGLNQKRRG